MAAACALAWVPGSAQGAGEAQGAAAVYTISVGWNGAPADAPEIAPLRFADDDATAFHTFAATFARRTFLLTVLDEDTGRRFALRRSDVLPPTLAELRRAVAEVKRAIGEDRRAGRDPAVIVFYSGHGRYKADGTAALTLLGGDLTQQLLYDEVVAQLPARAIHLLVDACHAEAVVRPRDAQARVVDVDPSEGAAHFERSTLARFPHVGAVIATTSSALAHEWDLYQSGIFTHEVLTGLRGGADVNGDERVEYSELAAWIAAANREVSDARVRLRAIVRPPAADPRAAIVDWSHAKSAARLVGEPAGLGPLYVEDGAGVRLADVKAEPGHRVALVLPPSQTLFLRAQTREAEFRLRPGQRLDLAELGFRAPSMGARGALESALRRGLFGAPFGAHYYRGFVDRDAGLSSVELPPGVAAARPSLELGAPHLRGGDAPARDRSGLGRALSWTALGGGVVLGGAAAVLGLRAWDARAAHDGAPHERAATDARGRYERELRWSAVSAILAAASAGLGVWLWSREVPRAAGRAGEP